MILSAIAKRLKYVKVKLIGYLARVSISLEQFDFLVNTIDFKWYSRQNKVGGGKYAVIIHYLRSGLEKGAAPCSEMASGDGCSLSHQGRIFLLMAGLRPFQKYESHATDTYAFEKIPNRESKRYAIFTAVTGSIDRLWPVPDEYLKYADFFAVLKNKEQIASGWRHVQMPSIDVSGNRLLARFVKMNFWKCAVNYDYAIWIDANVALAQSPDKIFDRVADEDMDIATFLHPMRNSIAEEAVECVVRNKENSSRIFTQVKKYNENASFVDSVLYETNVFAVRSSSRNLERIFRRWWNEILEGSVRDQISLPYVLSTEYDLRIKLIPYNARNSGSFVMIEHQIKA